MGRNPQLSILLSFRNEREKVEPVLEALFGLSSINFELFIVDDASTDGTGQAIHSLLDYYDYEKTFFFEHTKPAGRGNCLNELLRQINTNIVWAPHSVNNIDEAILEKSVKTLSKSAKPALIQQFTIPGNNKEWLNFIEKDSFPVDAHFLWNLDNIHSPDHFFNPWLNRFLD